MPLPTIYCLISPHEIDKCDKPTTVIKTNDLGLSDWMACMTSNHYMQKPEFIPLSIGELKIFFITNLLSISFSNLSTRKDVYIFYGVMPHISPYLSNICLNPMYTIVSSVRLHSNTFDPTNLIFGRHVVHDLLRPVIPC